MFRGIIFGGAQVAIPERLDADGHGPSTLVQVEWDEKSVSIFLVDLLERGEPVDGEGE
jgi:hypothetical protein